MRRMGWMLAAMTAAALAACGQAAPSGPPARVDEARLVNANADADNWLSYGRTYDEQRFSPLDQINAGNVGDLGLAWYAEFDTTRGHQASPLIIDGVLYTTTSWSKVHAFNARTGDLLWSYDPQVPGETAHKACCDVVNRGVAAWNGKVFVGALDGRLIALDAATGKEVWSTVTVDQSQAYTITMAPRVVKGKVIVGNGGGEYGVRGYVSAYDAETGKLAWRFYTVPNPEGKPDGAASDAVLAEKAAGTWFDGAWKETGGGGTVWDSLAYDPALNTLYVGVGNGSPWNHQIRSGGRGDNLFLSSILALDADTGAYKWHYQTTPGETWDYTATQHIMLADLTIAGQARKVLMQAPKNGFFYVIDRTNGQLISANNFVPITWASGVDLKTGRPIETPGARYPNGTIVLQSPSAFGAHNWHPMAFNEATGLVYIPAQLIPAAFQTQTGPFRFLQGAWNTGTNFLTAMLPDDEAQRKALRAMLKGELVAWDPVKQEARWRIEQPYSWNGGILSTAGNLIFQGTPEGELIAYAADTGKRLWAHQAGNGIIAPPVTYRINGEQYVAVMVGFGGAAIAAPIAYPARPATIPGRLLVFKLGGKATAPAYDIPQTAMLDLSQVEGVQTAAIAQGMNVYHQHCQVCHGANAVGGLLPDLRYSPTILDEASFKSVVWDGARASAGMVSFKPFIQEADVEAIRAYVVQEARRLERVTKEEANRSQTQG
jgi:quinohemoprotein ethanol dehydrogenase